MGRIKREHEPVPLERLLLADDSSEVREHIAAESQKACPTLQCLAQMCLSQIWPFLAFHLVKTLAGGLAIQA